MNKNFPAIRQNADAILSKTKNLMGIGNKILAKKSELSQSDDSWMERLWAWADENEISNEKLPRNKYELLILTDLDVAYNQLDKIPSEIGNLTSLTELNIAYNRLDEIPVEIGNLINLTKLSVFENELTSLPVEVGNLINLTELNIAGNQLFEIPSEIGNLINLTMLSVSDNQLVELPIEIGNLINLTELYAWQNQLIALPIWIGSFTKLTKLYAQGNLLTNLPVEIGNLINLTELSIRENLLPELPKEICGLVNLIELDLEMNELTELPKEIGNLVNLTKLELSDNPRLILSLEQEEWIEKLQENEYSDEATDDLLERIGKFDTETILTTSYNMMQEVIEDSNGTTPLSNHAVFLNWDDTIKALQKDNGDALIKFDDGTGYGLNFGDGKVIIIVKEIDGTPAFVNLKFYEKFYKEILQNSY